MQQYFKQNNGFKYLLTVIDVYSKYAWIIPLKTKSSNSIIEAFTDIFKDRKPKKLWTDNGKEFINKEFKQFLTKNNVDIYQTYNEGKAVVIERFNRTIKEKMWRYFTQLDTKTYIDILPKLVKEYNNTYHSTIKMTPTEGTKKKIIYIRDICKDKPKLKVGDRVRIYKYKTHFEKGYETNWTKEIFVIDKIRKTNPSTYVLKDLKNEPIIGSFYFQELQKTIF
jgi:hypothetical protein